MDEVRRTAAAPATQVAVAAVIERALGRCSITLYYDAVYLTQGASEWLEHWKATGWENGTVKNQDLWKRLDAAAALHSVAWQWVRGSRNRSRFWRE
jgi:ribonuclease HI